MSATTLAAPEKSVLPRSHTSTDGRDRPPLIRSRPAARSGRGPAPRSRPAHPVAPPSLVPVLDTRVRSCTAEAVASGPVVARPLAPGRTRITERGIALVLVAGAMIVLAAVVVVGLTAIRVTGDHYQPLPAAHALP